MKIIKQYVVDAFTDRVFKGNPAAVCVMNEWLSDDIMHKIAIENNLSETAFYVKVNDKYQLRWFTPKGEIDLCGHATLAAAYVITEFEETERKQIKFDTLRGTLTVKRENDLLAVDFPSFNLKSVEITDIIIQALGVRPIKAYMGADMVCVLENEEQVKNVVPNLDMIGRLDGLCLHITSRGTEYDCVTRTFAPKCNVAEDPVCGRGHCHIVPLWAKELKKGELRAYQASERSGVIYCSYRGERVVLRGKAAVFSKGKIYLRD